MVGRLEQRIKDLETQFDEEQRRLVDAERWVVKIGLMLILLDHIKCPFSSLEKVPETHKQEDQGAHLFPGGGPQEPRGRS